MLCIFHLPVLLLIMVICLHIHMFHLLCLHLSQGWSLHVGQAAHCCKIRLLLVIGYGHTLLLMFSIVCLLCLCIVVAPTYLLCPSRTMISLAKLAGWNLRQLHYLSSIGKYSIQRRAYHCTTHRSSASCFEAISSTTSSWPAPAAWSHPWVLVSISVIRNKL